VTFPNSNSRTASLTVCLLALLTLTACDAKWGGASIALINPAPPPEPEAETPETIRPLPQGPLLFMVRPASEGTSVVALPIAALADSSLTSFDSAGAWTESYRRRFDSTFLAPGTELALHADGRRIGSIVFGPSRRTLRSACPSAVLGEALLLPGQNMPPIAFAFRAPASGPLPTTLTPPLTDNRMRRFGPILTESLLARAGEMRGYLAQRAALAAVPAGADGRQALAGTYLIRDTFDEAAPGGPAVSLFFLAKRNPAKGFEPVWSIVRRYDSLEGKEAYEYFGWVQAPRGRIDFLTRLDRGGRHLAAAAEGSQRVGGGVDWIEPRFCAAERLLAGDAEK